MSFITGLVTAYQQLTTTWKEIPPALTCLFPSAQKSGKLFQVAWGDKSPGNKLPGQRKVWKKDKVHSFPRVRGRSLVLSKCKLITKRGRDNSEGNSKKP